MAPPDDTPGGDGFADFERSYPETSVVTLTAGMSWHGQSFVAWKIDGEMQEPGENTAQSVMDKSVAVKAAYRAPVFRPQQQVDTEPPLAISQQARHLVVTDVRNVTLRESEGDV